MSRNVNLVSFKVKTFVGTLGLRVPEKHTRWGFGLHFMSVVGSGKWVTETPTIWGNLVFDQRELQKENDFEEEKWVAYWLDNMLFGKHETNMEKVAMYRGEEWDPFWQDDDDDARRHHFVVECVGRWYSDQYHLPISLILEKCRHHFHMLLKVESPLWSCSL